MALPEMYRHSKRHEYFGTRLFIIYLLEAFAQVRGDGDSPLAFPI